MARGTQFGQLIEMFRAEARQAAQPSVGTDSLPHVKQLLRRWQEMLYNDYDWSYFYTFESVTLNAGQRYYDIPAGVNIDRVLDVNVIYSGLPHPVARGIGFNEYADYDPEDNERTDPVLKWDLRWTGTETQIEVWPLPASNGSKLTFKSMRPLRPLISEDNPVDLDDQLIVLFASAEELKAMGAKDADMKLALARDYLTTIRANSQAASAPVQMGLGRPSPRGHRAIVTVSG